MSTAATIAEINRLAEIGNTSKRQGPRRIADELTSLGITGHRRSTGQCPLANHLRSFTTRPIQFGRYGVTIGEGEDAITLRLTDAPGDLLVLRDFVAEFDDHPRRFHALRATEPPN